MPRLAAFVAVVLLAGLCFAQDTSALINKALDEQVKLNLNTVLPQAMEAITKQTGVRLEAQPAVWELLPWGQDTNISAKIENKTLREAMELLTRKLGLTFVLKDESVEIQPMPALRRLARRSTVQELTALDLLASTPANLATDRPTVKQLIDAVDARLVALKSPFAVENRTAEAVQQDKLVAVPRNASLLEALESLPKETNATWYPWGKSIIVVTKEDQTRRQLGKNVSVRYSGRDVMEVLMDLSARSGISFQFQPGAVQQVPIEARSVRALFENASVQQVLEAVSGSTGLAYTIKDEQVYVFRQSTAGAGGGQRDRVVGIIQLDNGMQVMVPQSQVPADMQEYLQLKTRKQLDKVRQMMIEEGFQPTTRPAPSTRPTTRSTNEDL
jgi:hypothetical protein